MDDIAGDFLARLGDLAGWTTGEFAWAGSGLGWTCEGSTNGWFRIGTLWLWPMTGWGYLAY